MLNMQEIQLSWDSWSDICDLISEFKNGTQGFVMEGGGIGFFFNNNDEHVKVYEGDWVIKDEKGNITIETEIQRKRRKTLDNLL